VRLLLEYMQVLAKASSGSKMWPRLRLTLSSARAFQHGALRSPPAACTAAPPQLSVADALGAASPSMVRESERTQHSGTDHLPPQLVPDALSEPKESTLLARRPSSTPQDAGKGTSHTCSMSTIKCELRSVGPDTTLSESSGLDSYPVSPSNLGLAFGPVLIDPAEGATLTVDELESPSLVDPNLRSCPPERHAPQRQGTLTILVDIQPEDVPGSTDGV
jgi:hypothetical protein